MGDEFFYEEDGKKQDSALWDDLLAGVDPPSAPEGESLFTPEQVAEAQRRIDNGENREDVLTEFAIEAALKDSSN